MSAVGRAREMEDEISVKMNLCRPEINGYRTVHFFGVFDGHGGHQPEREDEQKRIEALGGRISFSGNGARVEGILAMTRAIGDRFLKPLVISKPEYMFMKREAEDVSLILASDGLWDVLSSELSCEVAEMTVRGGGASYTAAALLVRLAMGLAMEH